LSSPSSASSSSQNSSSNYPIPPPHEKRKKHLAKNNHAQALQYIKKNIVCPHTANAIVNELTDKGFSNWEGDERQNLALFASKLLVVVYLHPKLESRKYRSKRIDEHYAGHNYPFVVKNLLGCGFITAEKRLGVLACPIFINRIKAAVESANKVSRMDKGDEINAPDEASLNTINTTPVASLRSGLDSTVVKQGYAGTIIVLLYGISHVHIIMY
jgi:hypothetical protein